MSEPAVSRKIDTGTDDLLGRVESQVAILTMNRPERRNALSGAMLRALRTTLLEVEQDPDVRCVVLTGASGAFCSGGDVKGMAEGQASGGRRRTLDETIHIQRLDQRGTAGKLYEMPSLQDGWAKQANEPKPSRRLRRGGFVVLRVGDPLDRHVLRCQ